MQGKYVAVESVETLISTLLTASITGAGLVIAIYALITPISNKIFERRLETLKKKLRQFEEVKAQTTPEEASKDAKILKALASEIREMKTFPSYLGSLVLFDFVLFAFTAFLSLFWFFSNREDVQTYGVVGLFALSAFLFLAVGMGSIIDVYGSMKREFEQLKKEKEEIEQAREQLEQVIDQTGHFSLSEYAKMRRREADKRPNKEDNDK